MTFPVELRERVVHAVLEGGRAYAEVAGEFGVSEPSFKRWVGKHRRVESLETKVYKLGHKPILDDADLRVLRDMVEAEPNIFSGVSQTLCKPAFVRRLNTGAHAPAADVPRDRRWVQADQKYPTLLKAEDRWDGAEAGGRPGPCTRECNDRGRVV